MTEYSVGMLVSSEKMSGEPTFNVDLDGFEGPLELLLDLARRHKIDLHGISVLAIADQYLGFIGSAHRVRLELAADYLVMAAYLAYLKSKLMLPDPVVDDAPTAADLAVDLVARLRRLELVRRAAEALAHRARLGRDVFFRGMAGLAPPEETRREASLYELLAAYARQREARAHARVVLSARVVWSLAQARALLEQRIGRLGDWTTLDRLFESEIGVAERSRTVRASTFSAALELVREGRLRLQQSAAFAPLYLRTPEPRQPGAR